MPYHVNLFWTCLKLVWLIVISFGILELLQIFHRFNITTSVQVLFTAIITIAPKVFDTIALTAGTQEKKEAWKKELQLNVKRMVKKEMGKAKADEKEMLLKTHLVIPVEENKTLYDQNINESVM